MFAKHIGSHPKYSDAIEKGLDYIKDNIKTVKEQKEKILNLMEDLKKALKNGLPINKPYLYKNIQTKEKLYKKWWEVVEKSVKK